tara:strand:+ start:1286 stop:1444 length:159 start_codon:yes stop_codon:yes gene_type:complete
MKTSSSLDELEDDGRDVTAGVVGPRRLNVTLSAFTSHIFSFYCITEFSTYLK